MNTLGGLTRTQALGRRIADAFDDVAGVIRGDVRTDVRFTHRVLRFDLPGRKVTDAEYARAKGLYDQLAEKAKLVGPDYWNMNFYKLTIDRYQAQEKADPRYPVEMHVLRLGDVAVSEHGLNSNSGAVHVYFSSGLSDRRIDGPGYSARMGSKLCTGDYNGDGYDDLSTSSTKRCSTTVRACSAETQRPFACGDLPAPRATRRQWGRTTRRTPISGLAAPLQRTFPGRGGGTPGC